MKNKYDYYNNQSSFQRWKTFFKQMRASEYGLLLTFIVILTLAFIGWIGYEAFNLWSSIQVDVTEISE